MKYTWLCSKVAWTTRNAGFEMSLNKLIGNPAGRWTRSTYFHRSQLAQVLIDEQLYDEAVATLLPAGRQQCGGEAEYYLSVAYTVKGREEEAVLWLGEAMREAPRWAAIARDDPRLRNRMGIARLLADT